MRKEIKNERYMYDNGDYVVIRPVDISFVVPYECPICSLSMRLSSDIAAFQKNGCCTDCSLAWAEGVYSEKWKNNWRPPQEAISLRVKLRSTQ